jgi:hypothetical protein
MRTSIVVIALALVGCGYPDPKSALPTPPTANDPAFSINGLRNWYLINDGLTPGDDKMTIIVTAPAGTDYVDAYVGNTPVIRMGAQSDGFALETSLLQVPAGTYDILFSANGSDTAFAKVTWNRSAAYYVLVTTDYDFSDPGTDAVVDMNAMHMNHSQLRITHFWAPYTYTDPMVTPARQAELDTWIQKQRDDFHDEIGLHIHPYCNFVVDAGMACITDQSTVYPAGDVSGYTIEVAAYGRDNFGVLLDHAKTIFAAHGLGTPVTFRAGGWTADVNTLLALGDKGFIADTSALNWARIEEWKGKVLYDWTMSHWAPIDDTSQPYYPSQADILMTQPGADMSLLEAPDNGVMIDYVSTAEMTQIFDENWDGTPFDAPKTLVMGFHPATGFVPDEYKRVDDFLKLADSHLHESDTGPVVYTTLSDLTAVFPAQ